MYHFKKDCIGKNNEVFVGKGSFIKAAQLYIRGNNNKLIIGEKVIIGPDCRFRLEGSNLLIEIKDGTTVTRKTEFCCQEDNSRLIIGEDCMLANRIVIRTSDTHPIRDLETNERINLSEDVIIGNHVWIAPNVKIMKGSEIPDGCIIGSDTTITKKYKEKNCMIVGRPAKIVKENILWTREPTF